MKENKLTPKQESLVLAMMTEPNFEKACERVGISRSTVYRYTKTRVFQQRLRRQQSEVMAENTRALYSHAQDAMKVLRDIMLDPYASPHARGQASKTLLEQAYKTYELTDIVNTIEELKVEIDEISERNSNAGSLKERTFRP